MGLQMFSLNMFQLQKKFFHAVVANNNMVSRVAKLHILITYIHQDIWFKTSGIGMRYTHHLMYTANTYDKVLPYIYGLITYKAVSYLLEQMHFITNNACNIYQQK